MLVVRDLWKSYGDLQVLKGITLTIEEGSLVTITGPNGSGKTTLVRILSGLLQPSRGFATIRGFKVGSFEARRLTTVILDKPLLYEDLTVEENLKLFKTLMGSGGGSYYNLAFEKLSINKVLYRKVGELSHGWRRRVDLVRALINDPKLVLFDELTTAFDLDTLRTVSEILGFMARNGSIVIVTGPNSHELMSVLNETTHLCELTNGILKCETS